MQRGTLPELPGVCGYRHFCRIWRKDTRVSNLVCRKYMPFTKCDVCVEYRDQTTETSDKSEKRRLRGEYAKHLYDIKRERLVYYRNRLRAQLDRKNYLSMIIDGADQSDHGIPHFSQRSHLTEASHKLRVKLMGVIAHGRGVWCFTCPPHIAQGNNVTIQALWDVCVAIKKKEGTLPRVLNLQLDNTAKQCKG